MVLTKEPYYILHYRKILSTEYYQTNAKYGYFLDDDLSEFDPEFFKISGKEAESMDPQQRLLLEVVYEALENGELLGPCLA